MSMAGFVEAVLEMYWRLHAYLQLSILSRI
jgi:hypothetical protein